MALPARCRGWEYGSGSSTRCTGSVITPALLWGKVGVWTASGSSDTAQHIVQYCKPHRKSPYNRNSVGDPRHYNFNEAITRRLHSNNDIHVIRSGEPQCRTRKSNNGANLTLQYDEIKSGHGLWCGMYNWCRSAWLCLIWCWLIAVTVRAPARPTTMCNHDQQQQQQAATS